MMTQPQAEAQQPSDGLVDELERRATFGGEIGTFQCPPELTARILAALEAQASRIAELEAGLRNIAEVGEWATTGWMRSQARTLLGDREG